MEQRMIRECFMRKRPLPERIQNAPDLFLGLELYFIAFLELTTCRNSGWGATPIPSWCIDEFCARNGLDDEDSDEMHYQIRHMDQAFLKHIASKPPKSS